MCIRDSALRVRAAQRRHLGAQSLVRGDRARVEVLDGVPLLCEPREFRGDGRPPVLIVLELDGPLEARAPCGLPAPRMLCNEGT